MSLSLYHFIVTEPVPWHSENRVKLCSGFSCKYHCKSHIMSHQQKKRGDRCWMDNTCNYIMYIFTSWYIWSYHTPFVSFSTKTSGHLLGSIGSEVETNVCALGKTGRLMYLMRKPLNPSAELLSCTRKSLDVAMSLFLIQVAGLQGEWLPVGFWKDPSGSNSKILAELGLSFQEASNYLKGTIRHLDFVVPGFLSVFLHVLQRMDVVTQRALLIPTIKISTIGLTPERRSARLLSSAGTMIILITAAALLLGWIWDRYSHCIHKSAWWGVQIVWFKRVKSIHTLQRASK